MRQCVFPLYAHFIINSTLMGNIGKYKIYKTPDIKQIQAPGERP